MFSFGQDEYNEYVKFMKLSEIAFDNGNVEMSDYYNEKSNEAYETYQYATGALTMDD